MNYTSKSNSIIAIGDTHDVQSFEKCFQKLPDGSVAVHIGDTGLNAWSNLVRLNQICIIRDIQLYVLRGNHDNPVLWTDNSLFHVNKDVKQGLMMVDTNDTLTLPNKKTILFVGGGISLDRSQRTLNSSYWADEVTQPIRVVKECDIMMSHDCPEEFNLSTASLKKGYFKDYLKIDATLYDDCVAQRALMTQYWKLSKVKQIISGHFHNNKTSEVDGTKYRCLDISEVREFDFS